MSASTTPILDREMPVPPPLASQPPRRTHWSRNKIIGGTLLFVAIVALALLDSSLQEVFLGKAKIFIVLSLLLEILFASFLVLVIHELGHMLAGWSMGFQFISVRFGPIEIDRRFRISVDSQLSTTSGLTSMLLTGTGGIRIRLFVFTLGGCVANLFSAAAVVLLPGGSLVLVWFVYLSTLTGIGNLIPFQRGSFLSDGKRIWRLLRPDALAKRRFAMMKIQALRNKGLSSDQIPSDLIVLVTSVADDSLLTFVAHHLAYSASWETGPEAETARCLEIALRYSSHAPPGLREALFCDAGCFQAKKRQNLDLARQWLADIPQAPSLPWSRLWLEAAILEAQKDFQGALRVVNEIGEIMKERSPEKSIPKSLQRWTAEINGKLNQTEPILQ